MIDLETLAASCATMADEIVARGSSDTFRYDADGVLEFGDNPEYYSPLSSAVTRSAFPETAREYGYTREYLEQAERRLLACVIGYCALDGELASIRDGGEDDNSRFIPIAAQNEGDWQALHEQAVGDIVVAHSWFRTLSGLDYAAGFSAERILHEYEVALNTVILAEQDELTEPIRAVIASVLGLDTTSLQIVNRPPTRSKPIYMKVWEARKADGLDYDPEDERQQAFLSEITKYNIRSIE